MAISFNGISTDVRTYGQYIEFDNSRAVQGAPVMPNVALIIGQRLAAGSVAKEVLVSIPSSAKGEEYAGHGSIAASMIEAFKRANPYTELWAIFLDDAGAGVAATGTITWGGASTAAGTIYLYVAGHRIPVAIPTGTAAADVGPLVVAAVTAYALAYNIPAAASGAAAITTFTARNKGTLGNAIDLRLNMGALETLPAGITAVIAAMGTVVAGATDPDVADALAVLGDTQFNIIACALSDDTNMDKVEAELLRRWGPMVMREGHCYIASGGTQAALTALGNARNSQFTTLFGVGLSPSAPWLCAAAVAGVDAYQKGIDPARPRQTLPIPGMVAPAREDEFTQAERNVLLSDGVSTYIVDQAGNCLIERLITTYQTNPLGVLDPSYLDVTTMHTLAYLRYSWRARIALRFPRCKLADDGTNFAPGQAVITPALGRSETIALFRDTWEPMGLVEDFDQFKTDLIVERNAGDPNRLDFLMSPDLMNAFRVMAGQIQFLL